MTKKKGWKKELNFGYSIKMEAYMNAISDILGLGESAHFHTKKGGDHNGRN